MSKMPPFRAPRDPVDVDQLFRMKPRELQELYRRIFGCDLLSGNSEQARRRIARCVQAEREGGLPESARERALAIARDSGLGLQLRVNQDRRSRGLPLKHTTTSRVVSDQDSRLPMPGSFLVKSYRNQTILVKVLGSDFEYDGRRFRSLSAIAREITGTRWNGFLFFGLAKDDPHGH
jgi:DUF2924 family protein